MSTSLVYHDFWHRIQGKEIPARYPGRNLVIKGIQKNGGWSWSAGLISLGRIKGCGRCGREEARKRESEMSAVSDCYSLFLVFFPSLAAISGSFFHAEKQIFCYKYFFIDLLPPKILSSCK